MRATTRRSAARAFAGRVSTARALAAGVAVVVAVSSVAVACTAGPRPIVLGALYPVGGRQGEGGLEEYRGVRLAVDLVNREGGVHGRPVELALVDSETGEAAPAAVDALSRRGLSVVLGSYGSTISAPAAVRAARRGMVLWETGAVGLQSPESEGGRHFFRMAPMGAGLGTAAVTFVHDVLTPKLPVSPARPLRYAVTWADDLYGRSVAQGALAEIANRGAPVAGGFPYDPRTTDFPALVARIGASHPDVLVVVAYLDDGIALRKATVAAHLPLVASIGTSSSYCMPDFGAALGSSAVGLFASDKPAAADVRVDALQSGARDALRWVRRQWTRRFGGAMEAPSLSGFANAWALVHDVLPRARSLDSGAVARAALDVKMPAGSLPNGSGIDFAAPGEPDAGANRAATSVIWEWVGVGQRAVVWPPAWATHPLNIVALDR